MIFRNVLLTGGAGFIGSHTAEALLRDGAKLTIVDNLDGFYSRERKKKNLEEIRRCGPFEFHEADICDLSALQRLMSATHPEAVIHLAARAGVRPSIEQPLLYDQVNLSGTVNLLELSRQFGVEKIIFGSSSSVYGATSRVPFAEDQVECRPISPYAATKLAGELFCYTYAHLFPLTIVCLRFFTVYGSRQRPDLAIHKFTGQIEAGEPIPVFGDGSTGRDYTHVSDIVAGLLAALTYQPQAVDGARFEVFNLGNSHPVRLSQLLDSLERATGRRARREQKPPQPGDVPLTWADISKAQRLLNYQPKVSLDEGLKSFVDWYRHDCVTA